MPHQENNPGYAPSSNLQEFPVLEMVVLQLPPSWLETVLMKVTPKKQEDNTPTQTRVPYLFESVRNKGLLISSQRVTPFELCQRCVHVHMTTTQFLVYTALLYCIVIQFCNSAAALYFVCMMQLHCMHCPVLMYCSSNVVIQFYPHVVYCCSFSNGAVCLEPQNEKEAIN